MKNIRIKLLEDYLRLLFMESTFTNRKKCSKKRHSQLMNQMRDEMKTALANLTEELI